MFSWNVVRAERRVVMCGKHPPEGSTSCLMPMVPMTPIDSPIYTDSSNCKLRKNTCAVRGSSIFTTISWKSRTALTRYINIGW